MDVYEIQKDWEVYLEMVTIPIILLLIAVLLFGFATWSRWWPAPPANPYHPTFISAGLFFWSLSQLWSFIAK